MARKKRRRVSYKDIDIWGIDGEAWSVGPDDPERGREHIYGLLLAANDRGDKPKFVESQGKALTTIECLDMVLELPTDAFIVAFSFKYDLTKMLEDLPDELLVKLNHINSQVDEKMGVSWEAPNGKTYFIQYLSSRFSVECNGVTRVVWDLFKFYQSSFVKTMKLWKVLDDLEKIAEMKEKRSEFDPSQLPEIRYYCNLECRNLSKLARLLLKALHDAGLDLEDKYYGAGSVGGAVLTRFDGAEESALTKAAFPEQMMMPILRAFSGGRFEISRCGPVRVPCYEYDISSAYPYQICRLPCLRHTCGEWVLVQDRKILDSARVALVHYDLSSEPKRELGWGPFPYRTEKGTITFPVTSGGGWVWLDEYRAGEDLFDNVKFVEAWIWIPNSTCHHPNPFREISKLYIERCRLGKDGAGIVIKLGYNAAYGKMAQSIGNALYNNWAWAGMITSGCRGQLLRLMAMHKDMSNIIMVATDGLYSTESLSPPMPEDTGTGPDRLFDENGKSKNAPLGGWEKSPVMQDGMCLIRPGIYFKLNDMSPDDKKKVKCRGIGLQQMINAREKLIEHFERTGGSEPYVFELTRFHGMKTSTGVKNASSLFPTDEVKPVYYRRPYYGRWKTMKHELSFSPMPKRGEGFKPRRLPDPELLDVSRPYRKALASMSDPETIAAQLAADQVSEQPDVGDYE